MRQLGVHRHAVMSMLMVREAFADPTWVATPPPPPERASCLPKEPFAPSWIILEGILGSTDFDF